MLFRSGLLRRHDEPARPPGTNAPHRNRQIKIVLIFKLERVLRSTDEWTPFRAFLKAHGCQLVSPTEDLSEATPSGRLKNNIVMSVNEYERDNTAEKIRIKLNEQAKRGFRTGGQVPFGYLYDEAKQGLSPHPTEAATLRRVFEMAAQLVSLTDIANTLNAEGLRTRRASSLWTQRACAPRCSRSANCCRH